MQDPAQRALLDKLTAMMTLVEGHGDYVMDAVGPRVVPSVAEIREKFSQRRGWTSRPEQFLRRILGIDLKIEAVREGWLLRRRGGRRGGHGQVQPGVDLAETLPTRAELAEPARMARAGRLSMGGALPPPVAAMRNAVRASSPALRGDLVLAAAPAAGLAGAGGGAGFVAPRAGLRAGRSPSITGSRRARRSAPRRWR